ncbi:hypothetical protein PQR57_46980 [Paraburkholderia dipogonis]|uniref:Uncharacterized protein n=1 Tax=Paraburkholderia dipogonis TaxID=1211383 RepID=A0ABW9B7B1_9BURK
MSTKATIRSHLQQGELPAWHLYEEVFEPGVIYLELRGVHVEMHTTQNGTDIALRLPLDTATQLGMHSIVPPAR